MTKPLTSRSRYGDVSPLTPIRMWMFQIRAESATSVCAYLTTHVVIEASKATMVDYITWVTQTRLKRSTDTMSASSLRILEVSFTCKLGLGFCARPICRSRPLV